jgi:hypothetical protein
MKAIQSPKRQRGATMLGMLTIGAILALGVYSIIRLWPVYYEYYTVARTLDGIAKENQGAANVAQLRTALSRAWEVQYISTVDPKDIEITKTGSGFEMHLQYEGRAPFVANVFWVVEFDKTVTIGNGPGGF